MKQLMALASSVCKASHQMQIQTLEYTPEAGGALGHLPVVECSKAYWGSQKGASARFMDILHGRQAFKNAHSSPASRSSGLQ